MKRFDPKFRQDSRQFNRNYQQQSQNNRPPPRREVPSNPYEASVHFLSSFTGPVVKLMDGESFDQLIRRFKKVVEYSGVLHELKKREFYLSPAQKVKDKKRRALKKLKKRLKRFAPPDEDKK